MPKTQMNVRIDEEVKRSGDDAFASLGYNPTQVVDLAWRFAARNQSNRRRMKSILAEMEASIDSEAAQRRTQTAAAIERHEDRMAKFLATASTMGAGEATILPDLTNEELHERAFEERAREKGWL